MSGWSGSDVYSTGSQPHLENRQAAMQLFRSPDFQNLLCKIAGSFVMKNVLRDFRKYENPLEG